jgi:hypothetical protein
MPASPGPTGALLPHVPAVGKLRHAYASSNWIAAVAAGGGPISLRSAAKLWIWLSALASAAGWTLSAMGQLNPKGSAVFAILAFLVWIWIGRACPDQPGLSRKRSIWRIAQKRFRRFLPMSFALLALLVLLSGLFYAPSNHTGLSYRVPRALHWLAEQHWHWIHTPNYRMNNRACGIEWLSAPILLFFKSDRGLFLLNFLPFLMMPGLVFSLFTRLGVREHVAWHWMWLLPTGYCFLVQASSIGNDAFPTVYALAAVDFALRARASQRVSDLFVSVLAAALLTGAKASNLPLLLPWGVAILGVGQLPLRRPVSAGFVAVLALAASFLPTAILNVVHCGDWSGLVLERSGMDMKNPFVGIWGNALLLVSNNFVPPFFPLAGWYNQSVSSWLPGFITGPMNANFEDGYLRLFELPTEDWAGLGFGVSSLVFVSLVAALRRGLRVSPATGFARLVSAWVRCGVTGGSWLALLAYCIKSGMVTPARLISPYYPLLIAPLLLLVGQTEVVRRLWWRVAEMLVVGTALGVLVVTPARPLWPGQTLLVQLAKSRPEDRLLQRASKVYSVYGLRSDPLANVRALLPRNESVIGFIGTEDDLDISFWRPFTTRKVKHFKLDDPVEWIRQCGIEYVVVGGFNLKMESKTLDWWLQKNGAELIGTVEAVVKVSEGPQPWHVARIAKQK